jgi:hypothetical protein
VPSRETGQAPVRCATPTWMVLWHPEPVEVRQSTGPPGGATIDLTAVELRALFNILSFVASGGVTTEKPERDMAARLRTQLQRALGELPNPSDN